MAQRSSGNRLTVAEALKQAAAVLDEAGIDSSLRQAEILLCFFLGLAKIDLYLRSRDLLDQGVFGRYMNAVRQRSEQVPLQYITGKADFYGLELIVKPGVFIPRPETEVLVEELIMLIREEFTEPLKIFDLCTGSGNIAVALTKNIHYCKIISSDISAAALETAAKNARDHGVDDRIKFFRGDLFDALSDCGDCKKDFDLIVANPPYVDQQQMRKLPKDVCQEPETALSGGEDGLDFYRRIIGQCGSSLKPQGYIAFEFGDNQAGHIKEIIETSLRFDKPRFFNDLNGINRFVIARRSNG